MLKNKERQKVVLPPHPKKHHKPFRWHHVALFLAGLLLGLLSTYRSGYLSEPKYDINAVSPATMKVYHFVCGVLVIDSQQKSNDVCSGNVGTGFFISSDGYIATSGHVVTKGAADILVDELQNNPALLQKYALSAGLSDSDLLDQGSMNRLLAGIYDLPPDKLRLEDRREITLVALGDKPISLSSQAEMRRLFDREDDEYIKEAYTVASDFSAKDLLIIEQEGNQEGFSASDIAVLKVNVRNAPFIKMADTSDVRQNQQISLIGFHADAENQLISNNTITPTITNGAVSSIRLAKGSSSRLFQSDADASQGSSGGPAVNSTGEAIGIVTYRFKDQNQANSAKSYIRDIEDLKALLSNKNIVLNTSSPTQEAWEKGLYLASQNKFSAAIEEYQTVLAAYPPHRLVNTYGVGAVKAIGEGKDVKEVNYLAITAGVGAGGFLALSSASVLIARHHRNHRRYRNIHTREKQIVSPSNPS